MKLQKRPKGLTDVKLDALASKTRSPEIMQVAYDRVMRQVSPESSPNKADKGEKDGSCNRTACQAPLADEEEHQFMSGRFTGGPRLYYCARCARDFDKWDHHSGDAVRIQREPKVCEGVGA